MLLNANDISLIFLVILIIMVLLEARKLSRTPAPVTRLEEQVQRLSQQMERIHPGDMSLPGGAQIVEAGRGVETIADQLDRLSEAADTPDAAMLLELREHLVVAQERVEAATRGVGAASDSMLSARAALQRMDATLDRMLVPTGPPDRETAAAGDGAGGGQGTG